MSALITEPTLHFSTQLAATIGLEEAILFQLLHDYASLQDKHSASISTRALQNKLAFWSLNDIQRVLKSLSDTGVLTLLSAPATQSADIVFSLTGSQQTTAPAMSKPSAQGGANRISPYWKPGSDTLKKLAHHQISETFAQQCLPEFVTYWQDRGEISHSWDAKFYKHVLRQWQHHQQEHHFLSNNNQTTSMAANWQPSPDALEILERNGINRDFIQDAIPEFILYWQERGDATKTWNTKFIQHVKRQWARFTSALQHDTEPKRIPANWQPGHEVFDILALANIDQNFAKSCIQEFVLYWKDSNQMHSSWNTKFLQHVKYCWANQHQLQGLRHEGQQNNAGSTSEFFSKNTDRSWADGL